MQAIEFETTVDAKGDFHLPEKYREVYGKHVRLMVLLPQTTSEFSPPRIMDPMQYNNTLDWPMDGLEYQEQARSEWE
jgi:DNA-binding transcriptional regulator/RsmH inhibitor MraZ